MTRNWVKIKDESCGTYSTSSQIKFKTSITRSSLCDYSNPYIRIKRTITIPNTATAGASVNNTNKKVMFKNCAPFSNCTNEINDTQVDDACDIDVVMSMYNLIEYSYIYSKTESLWQHYRDEPAIEIGDSIIHFPADNNSVLFKFKGKIRAQTGNNGTKDVEINVSLKYLVNFCRTLEMPLINC